MHTNASAISRHPTAVDTVLLPRLFGERFDPRAARWTEFF
jgi:hypothetical protein